MTNRSNEFQPGDYVRYKQQTTDALGVLTGRFITGTGRYVGPSRNGGAYAVIDVDAYGHHYWVDWDGLTKIADNVSLANRI